MCAGSADGGATYLPIAECTSLAGDAELPRPAPAPRPRRPDPRGGATPVECRPGRLQRRHDDRGRQRVGRREQPNTAVSWRVGTSQQPGGTTPGTRVLRRHRASRTAASAGSPSRRASPTRAPRPASTTGRHRAGDGGSAVRVSWRANSAVGDISNRTRDHCSADHRYPAQHRCVLKVGQAKQIKWSHNLGTTEAVNVDVSRTAAPPGSRSLRTSSTPATRPPCSPDRDRAGHDPRTDPRGMGERLRRRRSQRRRLHDPVRPDRDPTVACPTQREAEPVAVAVDAAGAAVSPDRLECWGRSPSCSGA
jgi:hypothetical protein